MNISRREFVGALLAGSVVAGAGGRVLGDDKSTWLTYAVDIETFGPRTPLLDRLKTLSESGFKEFEFGRFKTKDYLALNKTCQELDLKPVRFTVDTGIVDPKRKSSFLESLSDAVEVADLLGVKRLVIGAGEKQQKVEGDRQIEAILDALEAAVDQIKETEITLLLNPLVRRGDPKRRLAMDLNAASAIVDELKSTKVQLLVDFENGWTLDTRFIEQLSQSKVIGALRINSDRLKPDAKTAGLNPLELLRLIHKVNSSEALGVEFSPKADAAAALVALQKLDAAAKQ